MQYSPKLKMAIREIEGVLARHDIAGLIVLHTPGNTEYLLKLNPSYSCCKVEGEGLRIKASKDDYGSAEKRDLAIKDTSNMLSALAETTGIQAMMLYKVSDSLDEIVGADHTSGHTSHNTQNN